MSDAPFSAAQEDRLRALIDEQLIARLPTMLAEISKKLSEQRLRGQMQ